jgi:hypothetical protein
MEIRYVYSILNILYVTCKIAKNPQQISSKFRIKERRIRVYTTSIFNFDFNIFDTKNSKTHILLAHNFRENNAKFKLVLRVLLILISIFSTGKMTKTISILAQNFRANNAEFTLLHNVFSILISIYLARIIAETYIILTQNFRENNTDFENMRYVFLISILLFLTCKIAKTHIILAQNIRANSDV